MNGRTEKTKEKIIECLKTENKPTPLTKIAFFSGCNYYLCDKLINELKVSGKVIENIKGKRRYYELPKSC
jgi:predicted transcriptional regulator